MLSSFPVFCLDTDEIPLRAKTTPQSWSVSVVCDFWGPKAVCAGESAHRNTSHPDFILRFLLWGFYLNPPCSLSMVLSINSMSSLHSCESFCLSCSSLSQGMARYLIKVFPRWPPKLTLCMPCKYIWIRSLDMLSKMLRDITTRKQWQMQFYILSYIKTKHIWSMFPEKPEKIKYCLFMLFTCEHFHKTNKLGQSLK